MIKRCMVCGKIFETWEIREVRVGEDDTERSYFCPYCGAEDNAKYIDYEGEDE